MAKFIQDYHGSLCNSKDIKGIYRARVENNKDPLMIGRVQIRVPMIHGFPDSGISSKSLPWATPCFPSAGYGYGTFLVPEVGEYVFVIFEDSDTSKPVYLGSSYGVGSSSPKIYGSEDGQGTWESVKGVNEVPLDARRLEPTRKIIYKSPKGSSIEIDEQDGYESISVVDPLGQMLKMESCLTKGVKHKRYSGDMDFFEDWDKDHTESTRVVLMDSQHQRVEMIYDGKSGYIVVGNDDVSIRIDTSQDNSKIHLSVSDGTSLLIDNGKISIHGGDIDISGSTVNLISSLIKLVGDVTIVEP